MDDKDVHAKGTATATELRDEKEAYGHIANQEQHEQTVRQALTQRPKTIVWLIFAIWVLLITSFDNQVGGVVIGIPRFRQDFGSPFEGNYVLPAKWQSAYSGGPTAS
jgi:MFS transporter, SP family, general alpha glucoside:H+ symporter